MGKFTKAIFIFFSSLLILIVAAVIIIPLFIDLNDYKPEIEAAVKDETGRTLSIRGDLSVSVFPWLGISTGEISLSNAAGFEEENFALIGESDIKVKLIPLFSRKVEVRTIVLKGLELNLAKNKQGISNWDDLIKPKEAQDQQEAIAKKEGNKAEPLISAFVIGGLELKDAQISWNDQQSAQRLVINDFNLSSSAVAFNEPIELKLSFLLKNPDTAASEQLALSTSLVVDETLQKIQLKSFKLDSTTKGEPIPGGVFDAQLLTEVTLDLQQQTLALEKIQLNSNIIDLKGHLKASQLNTQLQYGGAIQIAAFSPKALLQQLQMDVPETTDSQVLQKFVMGFSLQGTKDSVALNKLDITLDDTKIVGNIRVKQFKKP
ncbi:MAG: AsmA family protein, partial [Methyloprofundus sp.]|nr:AsmA family protein [Methyloprofundus sp.]